MSALDRTLLAERTAAVEPCDALDMRVVHRAASDGPADLRAFLRALRDHLPTRT